MLPKDNLKEKMSAKKQTQLVKNVANTLWAMMNNLVLNSDSQSSLDVGGGKSTKKRCFETEAFDSLSMQMSSNPSITCLSDSAHNMALAECHKSALHHPPDKEFQKSKKRDIDTCRKCKNVDESDDMRQTSWNIPEDVTTTWLDYSSDTDLDKLNCRNRTNKKNSPKTHRLFVECAETADIFGTYGITEHKKIPVKSAGYASTSSIIQPAEQYFDTWYTNNDNCKKRINEKPVQCKLIKQKLTSPKDSKRCYRSKERPVDFQTSAEKTCHLSNDFQKPLERASHELKQNDFQKPSEKNSYKYKSYTDHKPYLTEDSLSSDSENDLKFTTIIKRRQLSSSDEDNKESTKKLRQNSQRNLSVSELQHFDDESENSDSDDGPRTIGYLVKKPVAKLCVSDRNKQLKQNTKRIGNKLSPKQEKKRTNMNKTWHGLAEGDHRTYKKPVKPLEEKNPEEIMKRKPRNRSSTKRDNKKPNEKPPIIFIGEHFTGCGKEDSDDGGVYVVQSHVNTKPNNLHTAKKAWITDHRADSCQYTVINKAWKSNGPTDNIQYSDIDKALCNLHACLRKATTKKEKVNMAFKNHASKHH